MTTISDTGTAIGLWHLPTEVTTRTVQGRLLLKPSHEFTDIILGIIGKGQALYGRD